MLAPQPALVLAPEPSAPAPQSAARRSHLIVLCGLVGSGKSTLADALQLHCNYMRACQDQLQDRRSTIDFVRRALQQQRDVVVDRTNVDAAQRAHWVRLGRSMGAQVDCIEFDTPREVCAERLRLRTTHETLHSVDQALFVLNTFSRDYRTPRPSEGFEHLLPLKPAGQAHPWTRDACEAVLASLAQAACPPLTAAEQQALDAPPPATGARGRGRGSAPGYRGRGRGAGPPPPRPAGPIGGPMPWREPRAFEAGPGYHMDGTAAARPAPRGPVQPQRVLGAPPGQPPPVPLELLHAAAQPPHQPQT